MRKRMLSILLAMHMIVGMLPTSIIAETTSTEGVAKVESTGETFATLQAAIDAAASGDTVTLLESITEGLAEKGLIVRSDDNIIIDLNDNTLTGGLWVDGIATVKNGIISNDVVLAGIELSADVNANSKLTVIDLEITTNRHALRIDGGTAIIESGVYTTNCASTLTGHAVNISSGANVTINGGQFIGSSNKPGGGTAATLRGAGTLLTINGGEFKNDSGDHTLGLWGGIISIKGGTFHKALTDTLNLGGVNAPSGSGTGELKGIEGGVFEFGETEKLDYSLLAANKAFEPAEVVSEGIAGKWYKVSDAYANVKDANDTTSKTNEGNYLTLQEAVTAASTSDTVTLLRDLNENIELKRNLKLALEEHKLISNITVPNENYTLTISGTNAASSIRILPTLTRVGHDCVWVDADGTVVAKEGTAFVILPEATAKTYKATWKPSVYAIEYELNGGTAGANAPATHTYGTATALVAPTKEGNTFDGWYTDSAYSNKVTNLAANDYTAPIKLYAKWIPNTYSIKYELDGGTAGANAPATHTYGTATALVAPTKEGYNFIGWYTDSAYSNKVDILSAAGYTADITLYAKWSINSYTITFAETDYKEATYEYGADVIAPAAPVKTGYAFTGWDKSIPTKMPAENITVTATWKANAYTIVLDANGGTGTMNSIPTVYDKSETLPASTFAKKDNHFIGWTTIKGGTTAEYADKASVMNLTSEAGATVTLYAVWSAKTAITPDTAAKAQTVTYNGKAQAFVLSEKDANNGFKLSYKQGETEVAAPIAAGSYDVVLTRAEDNTYAAYQSTIAGGLVIEKATLNATYKGETVKYGNTPALKVEITGFVNGETAESDATFTAPIVTNTNTAVGTYSLTPAGGSAKNYTFEYVAGDLVIVKADSEILPEENISATYGDTITLTAEVRNAAFTVFTIADQVEFYCGDKLLGAADVSYVGDVGRAVLSYNTAEGGIPVGGEQTITAVYGGSVSLNGTQSDSIKVTLAKRALAVSGIVAADRAYDGTNNVAISGGELNGIIGDDIVTLIIPAVGTVATPDTGTGKAVTIEAVSLGGEHADRYSVSAPTDVTVTIGSADTTVTLVPEKQTLTGAGTVKLTATLTGALEDAAVTVTAVGEADIVITNNNDGTFTAALPNATKTYTFRAEYVGDKNHNGANATCTVSVIEYQLPSSGSANTEVEVKPEATVTGDNKTATVVVPEETLDTVVEGTEAADTIVIAPTVSQGLETSVKSTVVELPKTSVENISVNTTSALEIETKHATVTIPSEALSSIVDQTAGTAPVNISVEIAEVAIADMGSELVDQGLALSDINKAKAVEVEIKDGAKSVNSFGGESIEIELPKLNGHVEGERYLVLSISDDGTIDRMVGFCVGDFIEVYTPHLTVFVTTDKVLPTVTFDYCDDRTPDTTELTDTHGKLTSLPTPAIRPAMNGHYIFDGWFTAPRGGIRVDSDMVFSADTTIYAQWKFIYLPAITEYKLTFETGLGTDIAPIRAMSGTTVNISGITSALEGYVFTGWYADPAMTIKLNSVILVKNTTVYAGWEKIAAPAPVEPAPVEPAAPVNPFNDIFESDSYYEDVLFVYANKLMDGTDKNLFSPERSTTRGMIVTILWRLEGSPEVAYDGKMTDVPEDMYYAPAVKWAIVNGILNGNGSGKFMPNDPITREQMATIMWRYAVYTGEDTSASDSVDMSNYTDVGKINDWAYAAMKWAVAKEIIVDDDGYLTPAESAKRSEIAAVLNRYNKIYKVL